ncbi:hypothetical protein FSP39_008564 [Pinctada imbricata]|uniref:C17orf113 probable zinc finger domain-containing protein n=1 Tax=Pinctada imbricata TaxID=66713 RepID=A0AA88YD79_PINIB|nr:hypothetical protein FSP39_008564 [Pinctada imbricata]
MSNKRKAQSTLFQSWNCEPKRQKTEENEKVSTQSNKENSSVSRKFKPEWTIKWSFVRYDVEKNAMFCKLCEKSGRNNIWTTSGCDRFKADAISKHAKTDDHLFATGAQKSSGDLDKSAAIAAEHERTAVEGLMMNIYYLAKRNKASSAIADLNKLLLHHNLTKFNSIQKGSKLMYEHHESVREMQNAMAKVVQDDLLDDIKNSAVYSIMADESTDVSTEKTLMLYVRYIKNGAPKVSFLEVVELAGDECNSENICNTILRVLEQRNLCVTNLSCITTDGASVMTGCRSGVTTLMKEKNCQLLSIHCIAHRLLSLLDKQQTTSHI